MSRADKDESTKKATSSMTETTTERESAAATGNSPAAPSAESNAAEQPLRFDGDNSFPDCEQCGRCCHINVIAVSPEEVARMREYTAERGIEPIDYGKDRCCFSGPDYRCRVWEARPQICRLFNCHVTRKEILRRNPNIVVDEDKPLIDIHDAFILGDASDPRYR